MKNIIKRIIVGVGIALILMLIKDKGLILQAQAKAYAFTPTSQKFVRSDDATYNQPITDFTLNSYPGVIFHGYVANGSSGTWRYAQYDFNLNDNIKGGYYNVDLLFYTNWQGELMDSFTFSIYHMNKFTTCTSTASNVTGATGTIAAAKNIIGIKCENVYLDYEEQSKMYLNIFLRGTQNYGNTLGITGATLNYLPSNGQQETADAVKEQNEIIQDETSPDTNNIFENNDDVGSLSNSPVSDLIIMPISILQAINNNANIACSTWNLGSLLGHDLKLPCINLQSILGSHLYNLIDMAICLFLAYNIGLLCISIYNNVISLHDDFDNMYSPRHSYHGRHEEGSVSD